MRHFWDWMGTHNLRGHRESGPLSCLDIVGGAGWDRSPRVAPEAWYYKPFGKTVRCDFLKEWWVGGSQNCKVSPPFGVVDLLSRSASEQSPRCSWCAGLWYLVRIRILRVLVIIREVRTDVPPIVFYVGGSCDKKWWQGSPKPLCPLILSGLRLLKDLDLSDQLILYASLRVFLQSSLLVITSRLCLRV